MRTVSVERCLDPNLTSVMVLSKGRSKAESNKRVKLGGRAGRPIPQLR